MLGAGRGAAIDAHEAVFRFNLAPTAGQWAPDVGSRTTYRLFNGQSRARAPRCAACSQVHRCCSLLTRTRARPLAGRVQAAEMAQEGATLQNYNNELVTCIEDLRSKRE